MYYGQRKQNLLFYWIYHVDRIFVFSLFKVHLAFLTLNVDRMTLPDPCLAGRFSLAKARPA